MICNDFFSFLPLYFFRKFLINLECGMSRHIQGHGSRVWGMGCALCSNCLELCFCPTFFSKHLRKSYITSMEAKIISSRLTKGYKGYAFKSNDLFFFLYIFANLTTLPWPVPKIPVPFFHFSSSPKIPTRRHPIWHFVLVTQSLNVLIFNIFLIFTGDRQSEVLLKVFWFNPVNFALSKDYP